MKTLLKQLVETESPSHDKAAVDRVGALVAAECRSLGAQVQVIPQTSAGDHLLARWPGVGKPLLILAHMDTVFPLGTLEKMPYVEKDGQIHGPGTLDMKSGIVIALEAIRRNQTAPRPDSRPIVALFTSDEEVGSLTSRPFIEEQARLAEMVFVLEAAMPDGALKTWRKGVGDYALTVRGRAAHAGGDHEKGRNAIEEMAHQVLKIQQLTDYGRGTTLNVGVIRGGIAANVVPDECVAEIDMRILHPEEAGRVDAALRALTPVLEGVTLQLSGELNRPPMPFNEVNQAAFAKAQSIAAGLGLGLKASGTGGGSDANFVAPLGVPVLDGLGAIGEGYHSEREYILASSLERQAAQLAAFLRAW